MTDVIAPLRRAYLQLPSAALSRELSEVLRRIGASFS